MMVVMMCLVLGFGTVFADSDIKPPRGAISVEGATLQDGVYYTTTLTPTLNITASDDVTTTENLKMIVSSTPINADFAKVDGNWES